MDSVFLLWFSKVYVFLQRGLDALQPASEVDAISKLTEAAAVGSYFNQMRFIDVFKAPAIGG